MTRFPSPAAPKAFALGLPVAACQSVNPGAGAGANAPPAAPGAPYSFREAPGAEDPGVFPAIAAGFTKTKVIEYKPVMADYSVGYRDTSADSGIFATLYFYRGGPSLAVQNAVETSVVLRRGTGSKVLDASTTTMVKDGQSYPARVTTFTFQDTIGGRAGAWYSRLVLIALPGYYVKLRATAPAEQGARLEARAQALLDAIDWASPRATPGPGTPARPGPPAAPPPNAT